jgi:hypothetical protein
LATVQYPSACSEFCVSEPEDGLQGTFGEDGTNDFIFCNCRCRSGRNQKSYQGVAHHVAMIAQRPFCANVVKGFITSTATRE